eukprot:3343642-Rhodomonas_salina.1
MRRGQGEQAVRGERGEEREEGRARERENKTGRNRGRTNSFGAGRLALALAGCTGLEYLNLWGNKIASEVASKFTEVLGGGVKI